MLAGQGGAAAVAVPVSSLRCRSSAVVVELLVELDPAGTAVVAAPVQPLYWRQGPATNQCAIGVCYPRGRERRHLETCKQVSQRHIEKALWGLKLR